VHAAGAFVYIKSGNAWVLEDRTAHQGQAQAPAQVLQATHVSSSFSTSLRSKYFRGLVWAAGKAGVQYASGSASRGAQLCSRCVPARCCKALDHGCMAAGDVAASAIAQRQV
jgi:hypothetical protein